MQVHKRFIKCVASVVLTAVMSTSELLNYPLISLYKVHAGASAIFGTVIMCHPALIMAVIHLSETDN